MTWIASVPDSWDRETAIILAHGAGQGMHSPFMCYFHEQLSRLGYLAVKFNFDYMERKRRLPDPQPRLQARFRAVVAEVEQQYQPRRIVIGGKSMGGRVASTIADDLAGVSGLVFLGYPLHPPGKPERLRDSHLYRLRIPMLFISGTRDTLAKRELLQKVVSQLGSRATIVWVEGGDHSFKRKRAEENVPVAAVEVIDGWIRKLSCL